MKEVAVHANNNQKSNEGTVPTKEIITSPDQINEQMQDENTTPGKANRFDTYHSGETYSYDNNTMMVHKGTIKNVE